MQLTPVLNPNDGSLRWSIDDIHVTATHHTTGWQVTHSGLAPIWVAGTLEEPPTVRLRFGDTDQVMHPVQTVLLSPNETRELWLSWPLEWVIQNGHQDPIGVLRPGRVRTLVGDADTGRVASAVRTRCVAGPTTLSTAEGLAAVHTIAHNRGAVPTTLVPFVLYPTTLLQFSHQGHLVAGTVSVALQDGSHSRVSSVAWEGPPGFTPLAPQEPSYRARGFHFEWLHDPTRRPKEETP